MFKEIMICIIIIITIFSLDVLTQNFTKNTTSYINNIFKELKQGILDENKQRIDENIKKIDDKWNQVHDKLAYYIEHDELEKVDTAIVSIKSFIETDDFSSAIAEVDVAAFVLEHIQKKNAFNLENIF